MPKEGIRYQSVVFMVAFGVLSFSTLYLPIYHVMSITMCIY